jgi:ABC-2 type transport system permease protein
VVETDVCRRPSRLHTYRVVIGSRVRAQLSYRVSFALTFVTAAGVGLIDFSEIYVLLSAVPVFGGLDLAQAALVVQLADLLFGQLDSIPTRLRLGQLEALLVRPMSVMGQLVTSDFQLRRLGRALVSVLLLAVVLPLVDIDWTAGRVYLLLVTPLVGATIYGAMFAVAGGVQFWLVDGAEFTSSFVYGGSYAGQVPGSVLPPLLRSVFTFVVPATLTGYAPALLLLGLPGPALLPAWLGWWGPVVAVWTWLLAAVAWRSGLRHFTGAGG